MADRPQPTRSAVARDALADAVEISGMADAGIGGDGDPYDQKVIATVIAKFLRRAADVHAGCWAMMEPRDLLKLLAAEVERIAAEEARAR